jgi:hypothetical protein
VHGFGKIWRLGLNSLPRNELTRPTTKRRSVWGRSLTPTRSSPCIPAPPHSPTAGQCLVLFYAPYRPVVTNGAHRSRHLHRSVLGATIHNHLAGQRVLPLQFLHQIHVCLLLILHVVRVHPVLDVLARCLSAEPLALLLQRQPHRVNELLLLARPQCRCQIHHLRLCSHQIP